jgi:hypothetical protein
MVFDATHTRLHQGAGYIAMNNRVMSFFATYALDQLMGKVARIVLRHNRF